MKVKNKYDYDYLSIYLKTAVVKRFRKLSRKLAKPQSETLDAMIDFFEWHGFSPFDTKERSFLRELLKNRKRTEAVIAIIKDIEKNHDKPTTAMLQSLFQGVVEKEEPVRKEKLFKDKSKTEKKQTRSTVSKTVHERTKLKLEEVRNGFGYVLDISNWSITGSETIISNWNYRSRSFYGSKGNWKINEDVYRYHKTENREYLREQCSGLCCLSGKGKLGNGEEAPAVWQSMDREDLFE